MPQAVTVNASYLINLTQNCSFAEEVWLLRVDYDVVKIARPITSHVAL